MNTSESNRKNYSVILPFMPLFLLPFVAHEVSRVVPGGPFLSITGDIIPISFCLISLFYGTLLVSRAPVELKVAAICVMFIDCFVIAERISDFMGFYFRPASRGNLFGW